MKVLFVGVTDRGAVSKIMKESLRILKNDVPNIELFCFGLGKNKKEACEFATFYTRAIRPFPNLLLCKIKNKILHLANFRTSLLYWKEVYKLLNTIISDIEPDIIVACSGPFFYMKAAYEAAKKNNKKLVLMFFDPFRDNPSIGNNKHLTVECDKWCSYASKILYDSDTTTPLEKMDDKKTESFLIPIFEKNYDCEQTNRIVYGGSFYKGFRSTDILCDFIKKNRNQQFEIFTDSGNAKRIKKMSLNNAIINEYTSSEKFEKACQKAKAIIVLGNKDMKATIPSKMLEAISLKKPIVGLNFSKKLYYINKYPFYFDAGNNADVLSAINKISFKEQNCFDVYSIFPERAPKDFTNKLLKSITQ